ncbi:hypothetical protein D3C87_1330650 [compost metagenome]
MASRDHSLLTMSITSKRNPLMPLASQKLITSAISARTAGLSQSRSAWLASKLCR